jgi:hypothetical protein
VLVLWGSSRVFCGNALCFTIDRGNDIVVAAIEALRLYVVGRHVYDIVSDLGPFSAELIHDSQLRWLGPEKGVMHVAIGAVVNAAWVLTAKLTGKSLWLTGQVGRAAEALRLDAPEASRFPEPRAAVTGGPGRGARLGANVHRTQAVAGDTRRLSPEVRSLGATVTDVARHLVRVWHAKGPGFESP